MIITKDDYKGNADQSVAYEILLLKTTSLEMNLPLFTHRGLRLRDKKKVEKQSFEVVSHYLSSSYLMLYVLLDTCNAQCDWMWSQTIKRAVIGCLFA